MIRANACSITNDHTKPRSITDDHTSADSLADYVRPEHTNTNNTEEENPTHPTQAPDTAA